MTTWTRCETCQRSTRKQFARFCDGCRWPRRLKRLKYRWTEEKDTYLRAQYDPQIAGRATHIANVLGWPKWAITGRARILGLAMEGLKNGHPTWTPAQIAIVERHAGRRHPHWIAQQVGRSVTAVVVKIKRLRLSRLPDGYSQGDVALAFGVERGTVERWQRQGWLRASFAPTKGQPHRMTDADVLAFVQAHRAAFDLRKVDQVWFLDLVLPSDMKAQRIA